MVKRDHTCEIPEELARVKAAGARVEQMSIDGVHEGIYLHCSVLQ